MIWLEIDQIDQVYDCHVVLGNEKKKTAPIWQVHDLF